MYVVGLPHFSLFFSQVRCGSRWMHCWEAKGQPTTTTSECIILSILSFSFPFSFSFHLSLSSSFILSLIPGMTLSVLHVSICCIFIRMFVCVSIANSTVCLCRYQSCIRRPHSLFSGYKHLQTSTHFHPHVPPEFRPSFSKEETSITFGCYEAHSYIWWNFAPLVISEKRHPEVHVESPYVWRIPSVIKEPEPERWLPRIKSDTSYRKKKRVLRRLPHLARNVVCSL